MNNKMLYAGAVAALLMAAGCAKPVSNADFARDAVQGDISEVSLGELGVQKATRPEVRDFAQTLVTDHGANKTDALALATELSVTPPTDSSDKAKGEYDKLSKLSGADFDKEFVSFMVAEHKADIDAFTKASKATDTRVAKFASDTLPTLQKHLDTAQSLEAKS